MADRETLLTWAATARRAREAAGVDLNGVRLETDETSRSVLTAAYVRARDNPDYTIPNWKIADGEYITLDAATILSAGTAVSNHIQACFDKNREIDDRIMSGEVTTREQIVAAFEEMN